MEGEREEKKVGRNEDRNERYEWIREKRNREEKREIEGSPVQPNKTFLAT